MADTYEASTSVDVAAPPETVWRALTDPELVRAYMHGTDVDTDWQVGHPITWRGDWNGRAYEDKGVVLACEPPRTLAVTHWSPLTGEPDTPEHYHHVRYELQPLGDDGTRVLLTHGNSPTQEAADQMVATGWTPTLQALKETAEHSA
jgi:uncharacterized protein YndB with AHSA1/START domain